ncbi:MAG: OmpA family protein [Nitrospirae bacterium]|jgi:outer membrane protein OmpA-like peptidoglycan-associated protein|nr:OmpA family protein [Nitrospirota bacterium]
MKQIIFTLILTIIMSAMALAQEDAEGCKDHPLFNRMPNYYLYNCEQVEFGSMKFPVGKPDSKNDNKIKSETVEGKIMAFYYYLKDEAVKASGLQIMRNFQNAAKQNGGIILAEYPGWCEGEYEYGNNINSGAIPWANGCTNWSTTIKMAKDNKEVWLFVSQTDEGYNMVIAEKEAMKQDIQANEMFDKLNKEGFIALYINFETGKADIKPESQKIIDQIVQMMKDNPGLRISIEGHTDNVGTAEFNQKLSENRALAVMNVIIEKGIDKSRLSSKGWGATKPVADNKTEEGKAKNRRVEIVKK